MTIGVCIPDLVNDGKITGKRADDIMRRYTRHYGRFERDMSPGAAAIEASKAALEELEREAATAKRRALLQVKAQERMIEDMAAYRGPDRFAAADALLAGDDYAPYLNVDKLTDAVRGRAHRLVEGILDRHSRNLIGNSRDKTGLEAIVRERFGEDTGNAAAKQLAEAFGTAGEYLRKRHNRAGGDIAHRADWGMPQRHDAAKLRASGKAAWKAAIAPRLDMERMVDGRTGKPFDAQSLDEALDDVFDTIVSDGWTRRTPGMGGPGRGSIAKARDHHRFLVFRSADDWMAYQDSFGAGDPFAIMMDHIDSMSRDIAMMERLGPNPDASIRFLTDWVEKEAATMTGVDEKAAGRAAAAVERIRDIHTAQTGRLDAPVHRGMARAMSGTRQFLTSAMLGSASISAITDLGFQNVARATNGLPQTRMIGGLLKLLNPASKADRRLAVRLGLQAEEASKRLRALSRFIDEGQGPEVTARLSDAVLRVSGLSAWTQAGRWEFGMSVLGHLADQRKTGWADLDPKLRGMMERYGMTGRDWAEIGKTKLHKERGGEWIDPMALPEDVGDRLLAMIASEVDYAVPSATVRSKALMSFNTRPGTIRGELIRNVGLFKSFGVSMIMTHGLRGWRQGGTGRLAYFARLTVTTTMLGALAYQLKEIAKGRDALPMDTPEFWAKAFLQGGGYGIFGDFIGSIEQAERYGPGGPAQVLAGPVIGGAADVGVLAFDTGKAAFNPDEADEIGQDVVRMARRYTPGGSIWYARAAYERAFLDQIQAEIDPDYASSWQRLERARWREGQEFWWRPGELAPERLPELGESP